MGRKPKLTPHQQAEAIKRRDPPHLRAMVSDADQRRL
jgi:hypothetical protein